VSERSERLDISGLGIEAVLRPDGAESAEGDLSFDLIGRARGFVTLPHLHVDQVERFEIIAGQMRVRLGGVWHLLRPGERFEVPAAAPHRQVPAGLEPGHIRVTVSPAGRTEEFMRHLAELSSAGQFTASGMPRPVAGARLIREFGDTGRAAFPPPGVQRGVAAALLGGERLQRVLRREIDAGVRHLWREYAFVDEWEVAAPADAVYAALVDGRTYPLWWRPVYIDVESDGAPAVGSVSRQHFKGRLPYHLHTRATLVRLEPGSLIEAVVDGDLRGRGVWTLTAAPASTHVRFEWTVFADRPLLRLLTPLLRPALRANHDWAIARAIDGLEPYVRSEPPPAAVP
jgi:hypothetical protein